MRKALEQMDRLTNDPKMNDRRNHETIDPTERFSVSSAWKSMNLVDATTHCPAFMIESGVTIGINSLLLFCRDRTIGLFLSAIETGGPFNVWEIIKLMILDSKFIF